jgi:photosystem II stability/assembly factor-like uncharacterized protein
MNSINLKRKFALSAVTAAFAIMSCGSARADAVTEWNQNAKQAKRTHHVWSNIGPRVVPPIAVDPVQLTRIQQGPCTKADGNCKPHGWTKIGPGEPSTVAKVAVDPGGSGTVYVASIGPGVRKSTDNGMTWTTISGGIQAISGFGGFAALALAMDASGPNTIYVGTFGPLPPATLPNSFMYKTTDGGATWSLLPGDQAAPNALAADPYTPGVVYEGTLMGFINKSTTGGSSWVRSRNGTAAVVDIEIDPVNTNNVYAATLGGGLGKTADAGLTWTTLPGLPSSAIWAVGIDPSNDNVIYASVNDAGIWRSADAGATWAPTGVIGALPRGFAFDPSSHTIFVGSTAGVWTSTDDGATWTQTALNDRLSIALALAPSNVLWASTAFGPEVSTDLGATWQDPDPGEGGQAYGYSVALDPLNTRKVFASTIGGVAMISEDRGVDWHPVDTSYAGESRAIRVDPTDSNRVYSGTFFAGVLKSTDGGASWTKRTFGSGFPYVWIVVPDPVESNIVYAGTQGEGAWKSYDYGDTWTKLPGFPLTVQGVTVDPRNHDEVYFGTQSGILHSHDGGATFVNVLPRASWHVTIVGGDSPVVYATTKQFGVYRSLDGGNTFAPINNGLTSLTMGRSAPVLVDPEHTNILYVGCESSGNLSGAFKSVNGGASWTQINDGLDDHAVFGMALDTDRPGLLYIAGPSGIYRTTTGGE